jgi:hypothetical protein
MGALPLLASVHDIIVDLRLLALVGLGFICAITNSFLSLKYRGGTIAPLYSS